MQQSTSRAGECLGHYRLIRRLGEGGFAEVYHGEHIHLKTQIAIKLLLTRLTEEAVERSLHALQGTLTALQQ